jgi:hypothetical protein
MKEIKVAKYSKQWCKTRMTIYFIICIISFALLLWQCQLWDIVMTNTAYIMSKL